MSLRPELQSIVDRLLASGNSGDPITLDALGEAIGSRAVTSPEIDAMITALEAKGQQVRAPEGGHGPGTLKQVLTTARVLRTELGRTPRPDEIAARAGLSAEQVTHALALARVMQR